MPRKLLSDEEKKKRRSESFKRYYDRNKERIRAQQKEYYTNTREVRREYQNSHWVNTQAIKERHKRARAQSFGVQVCEMPEDYEAILFERQNGMCHYCGEPLAEETTQLDHLTPHSRGGPHSFDNVVLSCLTCNLKKAQLTEEEFAMANKWDKLEDFRFCRQCMRGLPLEEFHVSNARNNGRAATCKECCKKYADAHKANG